MWRSWVLILIGQVFIKIFQLTSEVRRGLFLLSHIPPCTTSTRNLVKNYSILCFFGRAVDTRTVYCTNFPSPPYRYCMLFLLFHQNKFQIKTRLLLTNYTSILFKLTGNLNCRINRNNVDPRSHRQWRIDRFSYCTSASNTTLLRVDVEQS